MNAVYDKPGSDIGLNETHIAENAAVISKDTGSRLARHSHGRRTDDCAFGVSRTRTRHGQRKKNSAHAAKYISRLDQLSESASPNLR
jgi:hypothetical protein